MLLSVLMSVYKSEKAEYLNQALKSIWSLQTLQPNEIILIKDGPLGEDINIIVDKWKKIIGNNLIIISNTRNLGLTKSLNKGIKLAKGKYIARMDSDDISLPYRFDEQVNFLESHPDISVVGGWLQEFDSNCDCLNIRKYPCLDKDIRKYICKASPLAHPCVMMRREIFDSGIWYNEHYRTSQDLALWFDILSSGRKITNINKVILKFRREGDIFKRRGREKSKNELLIYFKGISKLHGLINLYYIYPILRFIFRNLPTSLLKRIYGSSFRTHLLQ